MLVLSTNLAFRMCTAQDTRMLPELFFAEWLNRADRVKAGRENASRASPSRGQDRADRVKCGCEMATRASLEEVE